MIKQYRIVVKAEPFDMAIYEAGKQLTKYRESLLRGVRTELPVRHELLSITQHNDFLHIVYLEIPSREGRIQ